MQPAFGQGQPEPDIHLKQSVTSIVTNDDGTYAFDVTLVVTNTGNEELVELQLRDDLDIFGAGGNAAASNFRILSGRLTLNPGYDGLNDIKLLTGKDKLLPGKQAVLRYTVTFEPGDGPGTYTNVGKAEAEGKESGTRVRDRAPCTLELDLEPEASFRKTANDPVYNNDGTYTVTFTLDATNTGNEELVKFQFKDDLDIFGDGELVSVGNQEILNGDLALNPAFDGIDDTRLLKGKDRLGPGQRARLRFDATFRPGTTGQECQNRALIWTEGRYSGTEVDFYESATFDCRPAPEPPQIDLTKTAGLATDLGNGLYSRLVTLVVSNPGIVDLSDVQVTDPLRIFGPTGSLERVEGIRSDDLIVNDDYDGDTDLNLLLDGNTLAAGSEPATIEFTVFFTPENEPGPFTNTSTATGYGGTPGSTVEAVASADITLPAATEPPQIALTKTAGLATDLGNGLYSRLVTLVVSNPGIVDLSDVQVTDPLEIFGPTGALDRVEGVRSDDLDVNNDFNGDTDQSLLLDGNSLAVGSEPATIEFTVFFRPGDEPGPFSNTATATGYGGTPASTVEAVSSADITLPVATEPPQIALTKTAGLATDLGNGLYSRLVTLVVSNPGVVDLSDVQVTDPLSIFGPSGALVRVEGVRSDELDVNEDFNGDTDQSLLLDGTSLAVDSEPATIEFTVFFRPENEPGPFTNTATATGYGGTPGRTVEAAASADITLPSAEPPQIALTQTAGLATDEGDGLFSRLVTLVVSNPGIVDLSNVQVTDPLDIFGPTGILERVEGIRSEDLAVNDDFDGDTDRNLLQDGNTLAAGSEPATIEFTVFFRPEDEPGPFTNTATATGFGGTPGRTVEAVASAEITLPAEPPQIALVQTAGLATDEGDGLYSRLITLVVSNPGIVDLSDVQVTDPLKIFGPTGTLERVEGVQSADLDVNEDFNGDTDQDLLLNGNSLAVGSEPATIEFTVFFRPEDEPGPFTNTAKATGFGGTPGSTVEAVSSAEISLPVVLPEIALTQVAGPATDEGDGLYSRLITLTVSNPGAADLADVQVTDSLEIFGPTGAHERIEDVRSDDLNVNDDFDGETDRNLLLDGNTLAVGSEPATIEFTVLFRPEDEPGPFTNTATATGYGGTPGTTVEAVASAQIGLPAQIALTKTAGQATYLGDGLFSRLITLAVTNTGDADLSEIQVTDPLEIFGPTGTLEGVDDIQSAELSVNTDFDGNTDLNVLLPGNALVAGSAPATIEFTVLFRSGDEPGPFTNTAIATGYASAAGTTVEAVASAEISLPVVPPEIALTQTAGLATDEGDGLFSRLITLVVSNPGIVDLSDVQVTDPLKIFDPTGTLVRVDDVESEDLLVNKDFNGDTDLNLLQDGNSLAVDSEPATIEFTVLFRPEDEEGPFTNTATATGFGGIPGRNAEAVASAEITLEGGGGGDVRSPDLALTKTADRYEVARGELVTYTVAVTNLKDEEIPGAELVDDMPAGFQLIPGNAFLLRGGLDGIPGTDDDDRLDISPTGTGRQLSFGSFDLDPDEQVLFRYQTRVGTGVANGTHTNVVTLTSTSNPPLTAFASVKVDSRNNADPMFEKTTIIGKVFDDRDDDQEQGPNEPGIAGVRLVTVSGLTIETDQFGRFHIADVAVDRFERGANFILKLDDSTLPDGAEVTSENPRVIRLTQATMSKINFAVTLPEVYVPPRNWDCIKSCVAFLPRTERARITPVRFESGLSVIPKDYEKEIKRVLDEYRNMRDVKLTFVGHTDSDPVIGRLALALDAGGEAGNLILSRNRARAVCEYAEKNFDVPVDCSRIEGKGSAQPLVPNTSEAAKEQNRRVEIEIDYLELTNSYTYEKVGADRCEAETTPSSPLLWTAEGPVDESGIVCDVHRQYFDRDRATAKDVRVSGGLFGCNQLVDPHLPGQTPGLAAGESELTVNASGSGDQDFPVENCDFTTEYQANCLLVPAIEAAPGRYPIELRTCNGSVLQVSSNGDVLRKGFPDNDERIILTPFRDEADVTEISAFRVLNEGIAGELAEHRWSEEEAAAPKQGRVTADSFVMDPRLDVLAIGNATLNQSRALTEDVPFVVYTNYAYFIDELVLEVYGRTRPGYPRRLLTSRTSGRRDDAYRFDEPFMLVSGDDLFRGVTNVEYVLKAIKYCEEDQEKVCFVDRTEPRLLILQGPNSVAEEPAPRREVWGMSNLAEQNIPITGDRVRVQGKYEGMASNIWIDQEELGITNARDRAFYVPLTENGAYVLEQYVPVGKYRYHTRIRAERNSNRQMIGADASGIRVSGGLFGCRELTDVVLKGRTSRNDNVVALTVVADPHQSQQSRTYHAGRCPEEVTPAQPSILVETKEGTRIQITENGDVLYRPFPGPVNNQQIVVTPFRDYTDPTIVSALRIENEGISNTVRKNDLWSQTFEVEVAATQGFLVALANVTVGENNVSGNIAPLAADDHFDGTVYTDGRMAMYARGKIQGKYLVTAQLDTTEDELRNMGDNLKRKDPRRLFRQLDPDRYYAIYGDDSTTTTDVDTQGAFYVRVDWNRNTALWGNFNTGITDTELMQYNRSLYGASFRHASQKSTTSGDPDSELTLFASEAQSAPAHVTFKATGGSLYYLRDTDIVMGSEKAWIEIRRRDTQQVVERQVLIAGRDYEVDALQGRIILSQPLSQVVNDRGNSIIRSTPLEGDEVYLLVDYEYVPDAFVADDMVLGARGKKWLGDHFSMGVTTIADNRGDTEYDLEGLDFVVKGDNGSYLSAELARSEARQSDDNFVSYDGGLSFQSQVSTDPGTSLEGDATAFEGRLDLADLGARGLLDGDIRAWWKSRDAGFSTGRLGQGVDVEESGVELHARVGDYVAISASHTKLEQALVATEKVTRVKAEGRGDRLSLGVELRHEDLDQVAPGQVRPVTGLGGAVGEGEALLLGARVGFDVNDETTLYATAQTATEQKGLYEDNDLVTVGINTRSFGDSAVSLEVSDGDRGSAVTAGVDLVTSSGLNFNVSGGVGSGATNQFATRYTMADGHELYGSYTVDPDRTDGARNLLTLGQRRAFGDHLALFSESQFGKSDSYADVGHVFGLEFDGIDNLSIVGTAQFSENNHSGIEFERQALSLGASTRGDEFRLSSRIEYREDEGLAVHNRQYISSNSVFWRMNDESFWAGRLNLSWTDDELNGGRSARFVEFDIGHTYRPTDNDRFNLLSKYSYLFDLPSEGQNTNRADERSHLLSVEGIYDLSDSWELAAKVAIRKGEIRLTRDSGPWQEFGLRMASVRARYNVTRKWDALAEYRWLSDIEGTNSRHGALLGLYRHVGDHFKIGVGFNFTDFNSDLRIDRYDNSGWFVDMIGKY